MAHRSSAKKRVQSDSEAKPDLPPGETGEESKSRSIKFTETDRIDTLPRILELVHARTGHDFSQYKASTMMRRIQRRQQVYHLDTPGEYLQLLAQRSEEVEALFQHLLVGVTCFFRDPEAFTAIEEKVIPSLMASRPLGEPFRAWVAGCATGEEAYSVAMVALEAFQAAKIHPQLQIFATDIDREALAVARRGRYPADIAATVSRERLRKFFVREGGGYRVKEDLRSAVRFAEHDIIRDAPFGGMHLISCRNVMIYLEREMQAKVYEIFHYALRPEGFLWLGPSESIDGVNDLFSVADKKQRIFHRRASSRTIRSPLVRQAAARDMAMRSTGPRTIPEGEMTLGQLHERMLLQELAQASVIITDNFDIVHTVGDSGPYLTIPAGDPTHNLMKVARKGLKMALRAALHQAFTLKSESRVENVRVKSTMGDILVDVTVRPVAEPPLLQPHAMVTFERHKVPAPGEGTLVNTAGVDPVIDQLEEELQQMRRQLQATVEAYETSNEELQSSNEELRSMNEELQSATEELEAGKEEFQSMNEELSAVNQTLKTKIEELSRANSDLRNFLAATDIGTMFLDRELCVIRYTPRLRDIFNVISSDKGRPLSHLTHTLDYPELESEAKRVLESLETIEREVAGPQGRWYLARLLPYRTVEDQIGGVVLTILDITERKRLEQELRFDADILSRIGDAVVAVDQAGRITYINNAASAMYKLTGPNAIGRLFNEYAACIEPTANHPLADSEILNVSSYLQGEHVHRTRDGREIPVDVTTSDLTDSAGRLVGRLLVIRDISERHRAMQVLEESEDRLRRITDAVPGVVYKLEQTVTGQRRFIFASRGCHDVLGLEAEQLTGDIDLLFQLILPSDVPAVKAALAESARNLQPFASEFRFKTLDGRIKWLSMRAQPHPAADHSVIWNGFLFDNTERREREDFLHSMYAGVESLIAVVDIGTDGNFVIADLNPAYKRLADRMGIFLKNANFHDLRNSWPADVVDEIELRYQECLNTGASVQYERRLEVKGKTEWFLTRLSPLRDAQGRIFRIISMSNSITESKEREEENLRASKLEALGVLAGGIAHDFNNIIMGISLNLDLLLHEMNPEDSLVELVRESSYATTRAGELSRRLLAFAKGGKPVKQVVDLKPSLRSVVDFALTGSNLKANYDINPDLECVDADLGQISQVFDNLVINAREVCREGGTIEVRADNIEIDEEQIVGLSAGRYVRVDIQDHGPGISKEIQEKIFDPYFTTKPGGNGIGLATCYTTLKNHGGAILVDSHEGEGATFSVYLPVAAERRPESEIVHTTMEPGSARLLLIDDDSLILSTMSRALRLHGYEVSISPEGAEGAAIYREALETGKPFDFVLLDANIPGGLGGEPALRALREINPDVKVILCSGYSASNLLSDWQESGFKGRLQKPFSVYDVSNVIRSIVSAGL